MQHQETGRIASRRDDEAPLRSYRGTLCRSRATPSVYAQCRESVAVWPCRGRTSKFLRAREHDERGGAFGVRAPPPFRTVALALSRVACTRPHKPLTTADDSRTTRVAPSVNATVPNGAILPRSSAPYLHLRQRLGSVGWAVWEKGLAAATTTRRRPRQPSGPRDSGPSAPLGRSLDQLGRVREEHAHHKLREGHLASWGVSERSMHITNSERVTWPSPSLSASAIMASTSASVASGLRARTAVASSLRVTTPEPSVSI